MESDPIETLAELDAPSERSEPTADLSVIRKKLTEPQQKLLAIIWCERQFQAAGVFEELVKKHRHRKPKSKSPETTYSNLLKLGMISLPEQEGKAYAGYYVRRDGALTEQGDAVARAIVGDKSATEYWEAELQAEIASSKASATKKRAESLKTRAAATADAAALLQSGHPLKQTSQRLSSNTHRNSEKIPVRELQLILELAREGALARAQAEAAAAESGSAAALSLTRPEPATPK